MVRHALYHIVVTTKATEESSGIFSVSYGIPSWYFVHIEADDSLATDFDNRDIIGSPVSYTHLTLPTNREV